MIALENSILKHTNSKSITASKPVQSLWSGYGEIRRYFLEGGKYSSVIVKHIQLPDDANHPRGWNTEISHQRKLKSYQVENNWYHNQAAKTNQNCKIPQILHSINKETELLLIMEDLNAIGYDIRLSPNSVNLNHARSCLSWLANFHATFLGVEPVSLWPIGTYWHLDTRPDEYDKMMNQNLKKYAHQIDRQLNGLKFKTLVHGDAKLANFCFGKSGEVAAVDFQYVGGGCGMKDVAYFISSCFSDDECELYEEELLNHYFNQLELFTPNNIDFQELKGEWSAMYKYAWADFYRFLDGWSPGHWKMHAYSEIITNQVIKELSI